MFNDTEASAMTPAERIAAAEAVRQKSEVFKVPAGDRLIGSAVVRRLRGGISRVTLNKHVKKGLVPEPDTTIAGLNYWLESRFVQRNDAA